MLFAAKVDISVIRAHSAAGDDPALHELVRDHLHQRPVLAGPGLAFVFFFFNGSGPPGFLPSSPPRPSPDPPFPAAPAGPLIWGHANPAARPDLPAATQLDLPGGGDHVPAWRDAQRHDRRQRGPGVDRARD